MTAWLQSFLVHSLLALFLTRTVQGRVLQGRVLEVRADSKVDHVQKESSILRFKIDIGKQKMTKDLSSIIAGSLTNVWNHSLHTPVEGVNDR